MMISTGKNFGFVCVPKCGSTSIEHAIRPHCNIKLSGNPRIKHMTYMDAEQYIFPMLATKQLDRPHMFAVIREPIDWLGSWYRYRSRKELKGTNNYAGDHSFEEFVRYCCSPNGPSFARVQDQSRFLVNAEGKVGVDTVLLYDQLGTSLPKFFKQFGIKMQSLPRKNVSAIKADVTAGLDEEYIEMAKENFAADYAILREIRQSTAPS